MISDVFFKICYGIIEHEAQNQLKRNPWNTLVAPPVSRVHGDSADNKVSFMAS